MSKMAIIEHINRICNQKDCGFRPTVNDEIVCFGCVRYVKREDFSMLIPTEEMEVTERLLFVGTSVVKKYVGDKIIALKGEMIYVSQAKKAQLLRDHPAWFKEIEEAGKTQSVETRPKIMEEIQQPDPIESIISRKKYKRGK